MEEDTFFLKGYQELVDGTKITFVYQNQEYQVKSPLVGSFNVLNLAAALLACFCRNMDIEQVLKKVEKLHQIEGRMEILPFTKEYTVYS